MVGAGWTEGCPEQLLLCWYALAAIVEQVQKGVEFCDPTRYVAGLNTIFFLPAPTLVTARPFDSTYH